MMKTEFENLAGREVTDEQYRAIETLYMSSNLEKTETGKYIIKPLEEKDFEKLAKDGHDLNLDTWFDFDYEDCIDEKKKPIELNY